MLTDFCSPTIGGIEQHVFSLSKKLVENKHQIAICTVKQKKMKSIEKLDGTIIYRLESLSQKMPLIYLNPDKKYHPPFQDILLRAKFEKLVKNFQPDIIHCHGWITFSYLPLQSKFRTPIIATLHHYGFLCPKQDMFFENKDLCQHPFTSACYQCAIENYGLFKSIFAANLVRIGERHLSKIDEFIAVSNFVKNLHVKHLRLPQNKITVIPNFYEPDNDQLFNCGDLPTDFILYVGELSPHKGIDLLLTAFKSSGVDLPLVMIGSKHCGHDYTKFDDGEKIIVREDAPRTLVLNAFKNCRFLVAPSIWPEPCPTTLLEAMSFGKPVLASFAGGIPEIVKHGETGYLFNLGNIQEFCAYLKVLTNDLVLCREMGERGKTRFLKYFTGEKVVKSIENLYSSHLRD